MSFTTTLILHSNDLCFSEEATFLRDSEALVRIAEITRRRESDKVRGSAREFSETFEGLFPVRWNRVSRIAVTRQVMRLPGQGVGKFCGRMVGFAYAHGATTRGQDPLFTRLIQAIIAGDAPEVTERMASSPSLVRQCLVEGATRQRASDFFFGEIAHRLYAGDTALHAAAAGYRLGIAKTLVEKGAPVIAANRRGAQRLRYATDGGPRWNSAPQ
jgi:hypothetical protein